MAAQTAEASGLIRSELPRSLTSDETAFRAALAVGNRLLVEPAAPGPAQRGRLAEHLEASVDTELELRGAAPPGTGAMSTLEECLADRLYRAKLLGFDGIALRLPDLTGIADGYGVVDPDDSATLRFWLEATDRHPVNLCFHEDTESLRIFTEPVTLGSLVPNSEGLPCAIIEYEPLPQAVAPALSASALAMRDAEVSSTWAEGADETQSQDASDSEIPQSFDALALISATPKDVIEAATMDVEAEPEVDLPVPTVASGAPLPPAKKPAPPRPKAELPTPDTKSAEQAERWIAELEATTGPKPLAAVERLYVSTYVPLTQLAALGYGGARAKRALADWSAAFEKSYSEAFDALRLRGKRPTMVLDVPDIAQRLARLHGARSCQVLLVDSMRFDIGQMINDRLHQQLEGSAACVERLLLWAGLPTTTATQLELIGRGPSGLGEFTGELDDSLLVNRGRGAANVRRIRTGHREVFKLDLIEAKLAEAGPSLGARFEPIATEASDAIAKHAHGLNPRTLLVVFGDHGFRLEDSDADHTAPASQGGSSPEEVLVPAYAWLIGSVH